MNPLRADEQTNTDQSEPNPFVYTVFYQSHLTYQIITLLLLQVMHSGNKTEYHSGTLG